MAGKQAEAGRAALRACVCALRRRPMLTGARGLPPAAPQVWLEIRKMNEITNLYGPTKREVKLDCGATTQAIVLEDLPAVLKMLIEFYRIEGAP